MPQPLYCTVTTFLAAKESTAEKVIDQVIIAMDRQLSRRFGRLEFHSTYQKMRFRFQFRCRLLVRNFVFGIQFNLLSVTILHFEVSLEAFRMIPFRLEPL